MLALLVLARTEGTAAYGFTTHYFPQELDHFSFTPASSTVFNQRYVVNDTFWARSHDAKVAGPIFVYMGNEGSVEAFVDNSGFMFDIAPKFGALLVFIEVRLSDELWLRLICMFSN
jgi:lysosomal Pro-X carboxypeptidase